MSLKSQSVFDPFGDVFLVLETNDDQSDHEKASLPQDNDSDVLPEEFPEPAPEDFPEALAEELPETPNNSSVPHIDADKKLATVSTKTSTRKVEMQVSSRHLSLASKVFDAMFGRKALEGVASDNRELVTIPLEGDDLRSLEILLNIVHGLTRRVPRKVERSVLSQVVVLIDKYEFHEVAEVYTDMWFESLRPEMPQSLRRDMASWIFICWELKKSKYFKNLTKIAILETDGRFEDRDGQVPFWIIDEIQSRRQDVLTELLRILSSLIELESRSRLRCRENEDCDALALGKLIKGLKAAELFPVPDPFFMNRSIKELFATVQQLDVSSLCKVYNKKSRKVHRYQNSDDEEGAFPRHLDGELRLSLSRLEEKFQGIPIKNGGLKGEADA